MTNSDINKKAMINALEKSLGIVTSACKAVGIARETHYRWMREDEDYSTSVKSIEDIALDFAESQLHKQISNGEVSSTIFYLKTKGKRRGYIERQEIDTNIAPVQITISDKI
jgi:hypothetical protein